MNDRPAPGGGTDLTDRAGLEDEELRILQLLALGMPTNAVARRVGVSGRTLRRRVRVICQRSGSENLLQAVVWAVRLDLL
jgi:DNA-binding NarL/FixJ family response regulator